MEELWLADRAKLRDLLTENPPYSRQELATRCGRSLAWVKKWVKRLQDAPPGDETVIQRRPSPPQSRTPAKQNPKVIARLLAIRDHPPDQLQRIPGPKAILYYLLQDDTLQDCRDAIPRSTRSIWKVLRQYGRIPHQPKIEHVPFELPSPMQSWQMDFKSVSSIPPDLKGKRQHGVEVLNVVDVGTSILVDSQARDDYHAATTILSLCQTFIAYGLPDMLTFDRDPRFVGSWGGQDFPSALVRFLLCLGVKVNILPPQRPDRNAFVERFHRALDQECLRVHRPINLAETLTCTQQFKWHYNVERPHQGRSCGNRPPYVAFPALPQLPPIPDEIDPDRWLNRIHGKLYTRRIDRNGSVLVDNRRYYIGQQLRGRYVVLRVDAAQREFAVLLEGNLFKRLAIKGLYHEPLEFGQYLKLICQEALSEWQKWKRTQRTRHPVYESG